MFFPAPVAPGSTRIAHCKFDLVHRDTGDRAMVQVKSGGTWFDESQNGGEKTNFLFASSGDYGPAIPDNVAVISRGELTNLLIVPLGVV
jgi:hypothetical protein